MRVRITVAVALLTAAALTLAGLAVYLVELGRIDQRAVIEAQQELDEFVAFVDLADIDPERLGQVVRGFLVRNVPDDDELLLGFAGGRRFVQPTDNPLPDDAAFLADVRPLALSGATGRIDTDQGEALVSTQAIGEPVRGALVVVNLLEPDRVALRETMRSYAVVAALALLLVTATAFWRAGRLLRPIRSLRETADEIGETDLSRRLPLVGNDDVTALTRTFNGMLDRLEAAFTGQRQLLDDAGHELRTPLTVLQGHLELLDGTDPAEVDEVRDLLLDETHRMARLVDDLILLAKTERPDFLSVSTVDVAGLTESIAAKAAGLGDRRWSIDQTADGAAVVDAQRVTQAVLQLAFNAVEHTTGPDDDVAIGSVRHDDDVLWWVRDTGRGVAPSDRSRIFERFGRGAGSGGAGFGLGLSIVAAIARAHGGRAWLDADYLDGARFVLAVPGAARDQQDV